MDSRKQKYIIIGALCLVVIGLSIGYAVLSANLKIGGTATVPAEKWSVIFVSENTTTSKSGKATCDIGKVTGTSITELSATFKIPGDSCTFTIPVENAGTIAAKLTDVEGINTPLSYTVKSPGDEDILRNNVTYEVYYGNTQINSETTFESIDILDSKEKTTVTLRVAFNSEATSIPNDTVTIEGLDRTFIFENVVSGDSSSGTVIPVSQTKPNAPVLNDGMIPVYYEERGTTDGVWKKADENNKDNIWYDYDHQKWANAVTVTESSRNHYKNEVEVGEEVSMDDINTMWVWIPRYSYTIQGKYGRGGTSAALPGAIDIKFLSKSDSAESGTANYTGNEQKNWRTPDAFNFGGTTQDGIWVGKFEIAGTLDSQDACVDENCNVKNLSIKPGVASLRYQRVSSFFYAARSMQKDKETFGFTDSGDLHMIKNDEWGAVAYLSQSKYGKHGNPDYSGRYEEIYQNKSAEYITGNSNGAPSQSETAPKQHAYNNLTKLGEGQGQAGPGASTTGNVYGVYDMSGGAWEYVMGVLSYYEDPYLPMSGNSTTSNSGFTGKVYENNEYTNFINEPALPFPKEKYYNLYKVGTTADTMPKTSDLNNSLKACNGRICYGQALSETLGWYDDYNGFVSNDGPWSVRGCGRSYATDAGIFASAQSGGNAFSHGSRFALISQ